MDLKELLHLTDELRGTCEEPAFSIANEVLVGKLSEFSRSIRGIETTSDSWLAALRVFVENKIGRKLEWKVSHPYTDLDGFIEELAARGLSAETSIHVIEEAG